MQRVLRGVGADKRPRALGVWCRACCAVNCDQANRGAFACVNSAHIVVCRLATRLGNSVHT